MNWLVAQGSVFAARAGENTDRGLVEPTRAAIGEHDEGDEQEKGGDRNGQTEQPPI